MHVRLIQLLMLQYGDTRTPPPPAVRAVLPVRIGDAIVDVFFPGKLPSEAAKGLRSITRGGRIK